MTSPALEHREKAPQSVKLAIIVTSDLLHEKALKGESIKDETGDLMENLILSSKHKLMHRVVVPNDGVELLKTVEEAISKGAEVILVSGGTGLGPRDISVDALAPMFEKTIPGFGELFRSLSYVELGSAAMLSRANAGVYKGSVIFVLPGSPHAAKLALTKLILPEAGHLIGELRGLRKKTVSDDS